ncbi:hypothetical protein PGT21_003512 [Puccinia graminis f. sp. tritici]|uniref:Uncharacterized protein n=1 Tax=Puccinia graminis f. sp. tritici TaxID=56615 RepID=A0A5B0LWM7_PUCGR|nr:hypothetical protein PGT21_003512 [Puccinia graminis f. sp. tritici]
MAIHFQSHGLTTINSTQPTPYLQISGHSQFYLASGTSSALPLAASILRLGLAAGACERSKVHIECVARPADKPGILYISSGFKRVKLKQCLLHIRYITRKDPGKHRRRRTSLGTTGQALHWESAGMAQVRHPQPAKVHQIRLQRIKLSNAQHVKVVRSALHRVMATGGNHQPSFHQMQNSLRRLSTASYNPKIV